jgi:hypothetical protein
MIMIPMIIFMVFNTSNWKDGDEAFYLLCVLLGVGGVGGIKKIAKKMLNGNGNGK